MLRSAIIAIASIALAGQSAHAQCDPIDTTFETDGEADFTVSAQTSATVKASQTATVLSCAQATVLGSGTVDLQGGTATLSGSLTVGGMFPGGPMVETVAFASASYASSGAIPTATYAAIQLPVFGTFTLGGAASSAYVTAGPSATAVWESGGTAVGMSARGGGASVEQRGASDGTLYVADGGRGVATFTGGMFNIAEAAADGDGTVSGSSVYVLAYEGGSMTASGDFITCYARATGYCEIKGNSAKLNIVAQGTASLAGGTAGVMTIYESGFGFIRGANTAYIETGGSAFVEAGATATIPGGDSVGSNVYVDEGATGFMELGARAYGDINAVMTAGPGTTVTSIGSAGGPTVIYEAREAQVSGLRRRAAPAPRATCGAFMSDCPRVGGGAFKCVDTTSDIFNCGGCALRGSGVDCTTLDNGGDMACVKGVCVIQA